MIESNVPKEYAISTRPNISDPFSQAAAAAALGRRAGLQLPAGAPPQVHLTCRVARLLQVGGPEWLVRAVLEQIDRQVYGEDVERSTELYEHRAV